MIFKRFPKSNRRKKITIYDHFTPAVTIQSSIIVYSFTVVCRLFCMADEGSSVRKKAFNQKSQAPLITAIEIYRGIKARAPP